MSNIVSFSGTQAFGVSPQPSIDRARGGVLQIEVTIPSETVPVDGARFPVQGRPPAPGTVTTKEMLTVIVIDWELLPLVCMSCYSVGHRQTGPDVLPYPPDQLEFSFS